MADAVFFSGDEGRGGSQRVAKDEAPAREAALRKLKALRDERSRRSNAFADEFGMRLALTEAVAGVIEEDKSVFRHPRLDRQEREVQSETAIPGRYNPDALRGGASSRREQPGRLFTGIGGEVEALPASAQKCGGLLWRVGIREIDEAALAGGKNTEPCKHRDYSGA